MSRIPYCSALFAHAQVTGNKPDDAPSWMTKQGRARATSRGESDDSDDDWGDEDAGAAKPKPSTVSQLADRTKTATKQPQNSRRLATRLATALVWPQLSSGRSSRVATALFWPKYTTVTIYTCSDVHVRVHALTRSL